MQANINTILLCLLFFLTACEPQPIITEQTDVRQDSIAKQIKGIPFDAFQTIEIEGCEYLIFKQEFDADQSVGFLTHKGNCAIRYL